jgi:hypothetical protein
MATILMFLPLISTSPALAETISGLTQDVYTYEPSSTPDRTTGYTVCNTSIVPNINFDVGGGVVADCQQDFVLIHWYGYITIPVDGEITFQSMADDGFWMSIDGNVVIDNWTLKGCSGNAGTHTFESGVSQKIDIWWYEYGGGACNQLYYSDNLTFVNLVPDSIWTTEPQAVVEPPVVEPPIVPIPEPPVVDPVPVDPPIVDPVIPDPPVEPVIPDPPVVPVDPQPPVIPDPPVVVPPIIPEPPVVIPPVIPEPPVVIPPVVIPDPPVVVPPIVPEPVPQGDPNIPAVITDLSQVDLQAVDPIQLTSEQATQLKEAALVVFETATEGSPEYQQALDALYLAAEQDDIVVDPGIANIPGVGQAAVALANIANLFGNAGADMSPKVREKSKKIVITAVVAVGAAVNAATGAALMASAPSGPSSGGGPSSGSSSNSEYRRRKD